MLDFFNSNVWDVRGGFNNQLLDDGSVYDADTKHVVGTCRFTVNYAYAYLLFGSQIHADFAAHGLAFLLSTHRDQQHGGFSWVLGADARGGGFAVSDGSKQCYAVAFALLALASAKKAGIAPEGMDLSAVEKAITEIWACAEQRFFEPEHGLYRDSYAAADWSGASEYRGQNPVCVPVPVLLPLLPACRATALLC